MGSYEHFNSNPLPADILNVSYINLPIEGLSLALLWMFLRINWDRETAIREKVKRIDIIGNILLIGSTVSVLIPLTWAGAIHPWSSPVIIIPVVFGILDLAAFGWFEDSRLVSEPVMPRRLFANRTSAAIYVNTFLVSMLNYGIFLFLPIYSQSVKLSNPHVVRSPDTTNYTNRHPWGGNRCNSFIPMGEVQTAA